MEIGIKIIEFSSDVFSKSTQLKDIIISPLFSNTNFSINIFEAISKNEEYKIKTHSQIIKIGLFNGKSLLGIGEININKKSQKIKISSEDKNKNKDNNLYYSGKAFFRKDFITSEDNESDIKDKTDLKVSEFNLNENNDSNKNSKEINKLETIESPNGFKRKKFSDLKNEKIKYNEKEQKDIYIDLKYKKCAPIKIQNLYNTENPNEQMNKNKIKNDNNILKDTNKNNYSYQNHTFQFFEDFYNTLKNNKEKLEQNKITIEDLIYNSNANLVNLKKLEKLFDIQKDK